jgi:hypothetical protein
MEEIPASMLNCGDARRYTRPPLSSWLGISISKNLAGYSRPAFRGRNQKQVSLAWGLATTLSVRYAGLLNVDFTCQATVSAIARLPALPQDGLRRGRCQPYVRQ